MIVGGNFVNKGAQAMTFVTIDELRKRFPDCEIHMYTNLNYRDNQKNYRFKIYDDLFFSMNTWEKTKYFIVSVAKAVLGRPKAFLSFVSYHKYRKKYTAVFDISGYALYAADKLHFAEQYLTNIEIPTKYGVPVFLLPQSFGPFNFKRQKEEMDLRIQNVLSKVQLIFAREEVGYNDLNKNYKLDNLVRSYDIVLQSKRINMKNVFKKLPEIKLPTLEGKENVAIVPNMRNFQNADKEKVLEIYCEFVNIILHFEKRVYLLRHSYEDIIACRQIKECFSDNEKVILLENEFTCYEYEEFVKQFDYLVASRFHSIVHAYKQGVPCIVLGWADKYHELTGTFGQQAYLFDIRNSEGKEEIKNAVEKINENWRKEKAIILEKLLLIQENNCFDLVAKKLMEVE